MKIGFADEARISQETDLPVHLGAVQTSWGRGAPGEAVEGLPPNGRAFLSHKQISSLS